MNNTSTIHTDAATTLDWMCTTKVLTIELVENMVITIEPGIYIPENSLCDKKWWGIAVRIEDDYLVLKSGYEHLSPNAPRKPEEIEALMKQPSALDDFNLPAIDLK